MHASTHYFLTLITDIGDSASLIAITLAGSLYLLSRRSGRAAIFLIATFIVSATAIALLKIAFAGCHSYFHLPTIESPSGHTADSAAVFWAYAMLMRSQLPEHRRTLPFLLLTLLIAAIGASRVMLGYHTVGEVLIGAASGFISIFVARLLVLRGKPVAPFDAYALALWAVIAGFAIHGTHLPAEEWLGTMTTEVKHHIHFC